MYNYNYTMKCVAFVCGTSNYTIFKRRVERFIGNQGREIVVSDEGFKTISSWVQINAEKMKGTKVQTLGARACSFWCMVHGWLLGPSLLLIRMRTAN